MCSLTESQSEIQTGLRRAAGKNSSLESVVVCIGPKQGFVHEYSEYQEILNTKQRGISKRAFRLFECIASLELSRRLSYYRGILAKHFLFKTRILLFAILSIFYMLKYEMIQSQMSTYFCARTFFQKSVI